MKHIKGGGTCGANIWIDSDYGRERIAVCNISMDAAMDLIDEHGGNWCCDSCGSASYC